MRTCAALLLMAAAIGTTAAHAETKPGNVCTIAAPPSRATIEARIPYADEFCELLSRSLAGDVFRAPLIVTPRRAWHYPNASLSCRLSFRGTESLTIRNSIATCRWLARHAAGWQLEDLADIGVDVSAAKPSAMTFGPDGALSISNFGFGAPAGAGEILRAEVP